MRRRRYWRLARDLSISAVLPLAMMALGLGLLFTLTTSDRDRARPEQLRIPDRMPFVIPLICRDLGRLGKLRQSWPPIGPKPYDGLIYVEGQLIITGDKQDIGEIVSLLRQQKGGLSADQERELLLRQSPVAIQLHKIDEKAAPRSAEQLACEVNVLQKLFGPEVSAEPNYNLSPAGWAGGGSPWTQNGQWAGRKGGGQGSASSADFRAQWALNEDGIHLYENQVRTIDVKGEGVRIGVFDTSPYAESLTETAKITIPWSTIMGTEDDDLAHGILEVHHFPLLESENCPGDNRHYVGDNLEDPGPNNIYETQSLEALDRSNHGLFVAGLAHAVAPYSQVHLYRVLEKDACGNLYSISEGIERFMAQAVADEVKNVVINLSLGVHRPPHSRLAGLPKEVITLQKVISDAIATENMQVIVVAAAGNDSWVSASPSEMEIPASDDGIIGVAASTKERDRGCFSNADMTGCPEKLAAPGGDGVRGEMRIAGAQPQTHDCTVPDCTLAGHDEKCLIGPVRRPTPGFAYWVGTSFAAPLVSGQRALILQANDLEAAVELTTTCPSSDPALSNGIINLPRSLGTPCPTPTPGP